MVEVNDVADYILDDMVGSKEELISNLHLQKLLYYCQGFSLAEHQKALFPDVIIRFESGPSIVPICIEYKEKYGLNPIPYPKSFDKSIFEGPIKNIIDSTLIRYGQFSCWKLAKMSRNEPPFLATKVNDIISIEEIKSYFLTLNMIFSNEI